LLLEIFHDAIEPMIQPQALTLASEPQANVERYDALRQVRRSGDAEHPW
jgi:hypothetical protein